MTESHWKLIKKILDAIPRPVGRRPILFSKDLLSVTERVSSLISPNKSKDHYIPYEHEGISCGSSISSAKLKNTGNDPVNSPLQKIDTKSGGYTKEVQKVIEGIGLRMSSSVKDNVPTWKTNPSTVSLTSINSRTSNILKSIVNADSLVSKLERIEKLSVHLKTFPDAKSHAIKCGAERILLSLRHKVLEEPLRCLINEILAVLGYCDPPPASGIRVLSIDGGGMRGLAVITMLQKLELITGKKLYELFDFICGVSTGAIITCCAVPPLSMNMEHLQKLYMDLSQKVFKQNTLWGTSKLVFSRAYYETSVWEGLLKDNVGGTTLIETNRHQPCPKICVISTLVNQARVSPFLFRNYSLPYLGSSDYQGSSSHTLFEAVRASAAAPTIFQEYRTGEYLHQDGGILVNNPTAVAIHEVKSLWPDEKLSCVVSCGTGRHNHVPTVRDNEESSKSSISWKKIFEKILDSATDTEGVHTMLNDLLPEDVYHRFNPHLTEDIAMDEIREDKIKILEEDTLMYCRRNEEKFLTVAKKLTEPRSKLNKLFDFSKLQIKLSGYAP